jgi:hypothetical protein
MIAELRGLITELMHYLMPTTEIDGDVMFWWWTAVVWWGTLAAVDIIVRLGMHVI